MDATTLENVRSGVQPQAGRLVGVRNTFLFQAPPSSRWVAGERWCGRAPGFPIEQEWVITKVRARGGRVKVWGVQGSGLRNRRAHPPRSLREWEA